MCSGLHAKEPILLNGQKCRVYVKFEAFYLVMVTSPNDEIYSNGTKKTPKNRKWQNSREPINQSPFLLTAMLSEDNILLSMLIAN